jgi:hypothetical protein
MEEKEFDLEQFQAEFEAEWDNSEDDNNVENEEVVDETVDTVDNPEDEEPQEEEPQTEEPPINDPDQEKRNRAFADMRRQLEESKKYADFLKNLAEQNGTTPDELLSRYQERQLEAEAEKQQVPVDVLKRINALEQENQTIKQNTFAERFQVQVDSVADKYGANEDDIRETFKYAIENGIDFENSRISFDAVYKMAHHDTLVQKQVEQARQKDLEEKRKRQSTSALPSGTSTSPSSDDLSDEAVLKMLKDMDIQI